MNRNRISKFLLIISFCCFSADCCFSAELYVKSENEITNSKSNDNVQKINKFEKELKNDSKDIKINSSSKRSTMSEFVSWIPWIITLVSCCSCSHISNSAVKESNKLIEKLEKTNEDLKNEIINIKCQISASDDKVKSEVNELLEKFKKKIKRQDKLIFWFSKIDKEIMESIRKIYFRNANLPKLNCVLNQFDNLPDCFFEVDCIWNHILQDKSAENQKIYAKFMFFIALAICYPESAPDSINDNSLHIQKIEKNENFIIIKTDITDILENKFNFKINCSSGELEFN